MSKIVVNKKITVCLLVVMVFLGREKYSSGFKFNSVGIRKLCSNLNSAP